MPKLEGRVAIVAGVGRNFGEGIAQALADEGARVALADRHPDRVEAAAAAINANANGQDVALGIECEAASSENVRRMVGQVVERWGQIDVLVNNIGFVDRHTEVLELEEAEWDRFMGATLKSMFLCAKYVAERMVGRGEGGRIINITGRDIASTFQAEGGMLSLTVQGGVLSLTRALAVQLAPHHIRVNCITPSRVQKVNEPAVGEPKNFIGREATAYDIARAAVFLASADADFINGIELRVDGGATASG